jgi:hypothetical protein
LQLTWRGRYFYLWKIQRDRDFNSAVSSSDNMAPNSTIVDE